MFLFLLELKIVLSVLCCMGLLIKLLSRQSSLTFSASHQNVPSLADSTELKQISLLVYNVEGWGLRDIVFTGLRCAFTVFQVPRFLLGWPSSAFSLN